MELTLKTTITENERDLVIGDEEIAYTPSGNGAQRFRRSITHAAEVEIDIDAGILAGNDPGLVRIKNEDPTNFLKVGVATGVYGNEVLPGQAIQIFVPASTTKLFLRADTNPCFVDGVIYER